MCSVSVVISINAALRRGRKAQMYGSSLYGPVSKTALTSVTRMSISNDQAERENRPMSKSDYDILMKSYRRLMTLMRSGNAAAAEAHWRKHLDVANSLLFAGMEDLKVRDVMR